METSFEEIDQDFKTYSDLTDPSHAGYKAEYKRFCKMDPRRINIGT